MSDTALIALIAVAGAVVAAVPPTILALATYHKTLTVEAKSDVLIEKAAEIHTLTNSNLTTVTAALAVANEKIVGLEKLLAEIVKRGDRRGDKTLPPEGSA